MDKETKKEKGIRKNETSLYDAVKHKDGIQEGDKVWVYYNNNDGLTLAEALSALAALIASVQDGLDAQDLAEGNVASYILAQVSEGIDMGDMPGGLGTYLRLVSDGLQFGEEALSDGRQRARTNRPVVQQCRHKCSGGSAGGA